MYCVDPYLCKTCEDDNFDKKQKSKATESKETFLIQFGLERKV